jgi:hypothetical protein
VSHDLSLPEGSVLVHVGPYKTGTTAIQASLHQHRADLLQHGVLYPGTEVRQFRAEWALTGRTPHGVPPVPKRRWDELVAEVRGSSATRVCISSEGLSSASPSAVRQLVGDLGPDRVHVLVVARRLDKLLPSAWQERVKSSHEHRTYDVWLREVLEDAASDRPRHTFWRNHRLANIIERWGVVVPRERMLVLVADETDRSQQLRTFEHLLGLPERLLTPGPRSNSSLSYERIEFYRLVNQTFDERGWDDVHRRQLITKGLLQGLLTAPAQPHDLPLPELPHWATERVARLSDERVEEVRSLGVPVIGDPELLRSAVAGGDGDLGAPPDAIPIRTAASAVAGLVAAAMKLEATARRQSAREAGRQSPTASNQLGAAVDRLSSKELLGIVTRRQLGRLRRLRRPRRLRRLRRLGR